MAPKKMPYNQLSKSGKYFRDHPAARKAKTATALEVGKSPEKRKYRSQLVTLRRKAGIYGKGGKDIGHVTKTKTRLEEPSKNRGNKKKFIFKKKD
jgi:hypothetical protein